MRNVCAWRQNNSAGSVRLLLLQGEYAYRYVIEKGATDDHKKQNHEKEAPQPAHS